MELVTCIAGKIVDYTVEPIKRQVDYVVHCKSNLEKLEIELNDLADARRTRGRKIDEAKTKGEIILKEVEEWVKEVDEVTGKANQLKDERVNGCCLNLKMRHQLSKKSIQLVEKIVRLRDKQFPEKISCGYHREEVCSISTGDYMPFDSRESAVEQVMDELKNPKSVRIGVCGIGGVGKTTLVKEVFRKATQDTSLFDKVAILLDVKSIQDSEGIQKQIVEKLGMDILGSETMVNRVGRLCGYIKGKKILIILDDVQTKIDLEQLGVPGVATCKILLTSRIPIPGMTPNKGFKLGILPEEEAWELFENKAGVLDKIPAIQRVAKQVAKKCGGLPVLIVTVASSLKDRNSPPLWEDALRCLEEFDHTDESPEEEAHSTIEWSYNQLVDSILKDLFLLCGTTVRGNRIFLEDLLEYSVGLSLFKNVRTLEQKRNAFYSKVEKLKDFCLLIDGEDDTSVRMHDIVRDTARHIALRDHHMLSAVEDGGDDQSDGKGWPNNELTEKCTTISFPSANNIPEVLQCPALEMFLLQGNGRYGDPLKILPDFFKETKQLRVLCLEWMNIPSLPSSLRFLNNLQTLCLRGCQLRDLSLVGQLNNLEILSLQGSVVEQLPKEIGQLTRLRLLDLSNCDRLEVVSPGVISSLTRLEELRMRESFKNWKAAGDGSNAGLFELSHLSQLTALEVHVPNADILPADFLSHHELKRFQIMIGDGWFWDYNKNDRTLNTLKLKLTTTSIELERGLKKLLKICDDLSLDGTESVNHIVRQLDSQDCPQVRHLRVRDNVDFEYIRNKDVLTFMSLTTLRVDGCHRLSFLFSFSMAKSLAELKHLQISDCKIMEVIVECGQENIDNMFSKLEDLNLHNLPKLTIFFSDPKMLVSHWRLLKRMEVINCGEVKSFAAENHELNPETQQSLFLIDESSFPNLEDLALGGMEIWNGPPPAELVFGKLKYIRLLPGCAPSALLLAKLFPNLESIDGWDNSCEKIFVNTGNTSCGEIHAVGSGTLPHVRQLNLYKSDVLHLGNSQSAAGPLFPNLQTLDMWLCYRLKNLDSSTISFQNLTTLMVRRCDGLEYLMSYSVAKNLVQLTRLEVWECKSVVVIVQASNIVGDDDDAAGNEIAFSSLQLLGFFDLPSLQVFCSSENCIVKFPSSVTLSVHKCPIKLNISPDGVLLTEKVDQEDEDNNFIVEDKDDEDEEEEEDDDKQKGVDDDDDNEQD